MTQAPPGWYPDQNGTMRWWDGSQWGQAAAVKTDNARLYAVFAHLGIFLVGIVVPLVLYLTVGKEDRFVKHHAAEALNFQISVLIGGFVLVGVMFAGMIGGAAMEFAGPVVGVFLLMFGWIIGVYALAILGAVRAGGGQLWRYPINIRFVSNN